MAKRNPTTNRPSSPPIPDAAIVTSTQSDRSLGGVAVAKIFSISMLTIAIVVIGVLFYQVMASFFVPLFLAALLVVIFRPVHERILQRVDGRTRIASILTTGFILLLVLLPATLVISIAAAQGIAFTRQLSSTGLSNSLDRLRDSLSLTMPHAETFRGLEEQVEALRDPSVTSAAIERFDDTEDAITFLQAELGHQGDMALAGANDEVLERLLADLERLRRSAAEVAGLVGSEDPIPRQIARARYGDHYIELRHSLREWTQSLLGTSVWAQLRYLANPSESEIQALIAGAQDYIQPRVLPLTQVAGRFLFQSLIGIGILIIAVYFFFADGRGMVTTLMRLSPLDDEYERRLLLQFDQTSRAVVLASVLSALAQGILAALAYWFFGLPSVILLFMATTFMSLVPFLGAAAIWVPAAIYLGFVEQRLVAAAILAVYGTLVVGTIDNVIKMFVLQGRSQLHPLLALLSVLGGMQVFGPIGILVGPMVVVFLQTLLEILNHELESQTGKELVASTDPQPQSPVEVNLES